jgi:hypothetical protein
MGTDAFQRTLRTVMKDTPILRTRLVDLPGNSTVQVVVDEEPTWTHFHHRSDILAERSSEFALGTGLSRLGLHLDKQSGENTFI